MRVKQKHSDVIAGISPYTFLLNISCSKQFLTPPSIQAVEIWTIVVMQNMFTNFQSASLIISGIYKPCIFTLLADFPLAECPLYLLSLR